MVQGLIELPSGTSKLFDLTLTSHREFFMHVLLGGDPQGRPRAAEGVTYRLGLETPRIPPGGDKSVAGDKAEFPINLSHV